MNTMPRMALPPRRVLYLNFDRGIPVLGEKGASVHVRCMVNALASLGHDVLLCCTRTGAGNAPPRGVLVELGSQVANALLLAESIIRGAGLPPDSDTTLRRELNRLALDRVLPARVGAALAQAGWAAPQLVYERQALFHTAGVEIARAHGVPRILEVNAPLVEEQARHRTLELRDAAAAAEQISYAGADLIVAVSDAVARHVVARGADPARVMVAQNGADTASFRPQAEAGESLRAQHGLQGAVVAGFVGSFKAWHGFDMLLDAFDALAPRFPQARLLAVGTGPMLEAARARVAATPLAARVVFTGDIPHAAVPAHLAAMDFTVAPYLPQPDFYFSPLKIVESMAAGRPVVAPRLGQIETLVTDGETGLLYAPDDARACADAIGVLLESAGLRARMGLRAALHAQAEWDWTRIADRVLRGVAVA